MRALAHPYATARLLLIVMLRNRYCSMPPGCSDRTADKQEKTSTMRATTRLRRMFEDGHTIVAPGVADGLSARLVAQAGFKAVYQPVDLPILD
jgi:hypothetical protein